MNRAWAPLLSCLTLCDPMDCSPPSSSVHGILQARILEQVAFPPPGYLSDPGIKPESPALTGGFFVTGATWEAQWAWVSAESLSRVRLCVTHGLQPAGLLCPCDSPGKSTGVGCHFLLQGIFPTLCLFCLLRWQAGSLPRAPPGEPQSEWVQVSYWSPLFSFRGYLVARGIGTEVFYFET